MTGRDQGPTGDLDLNAGALAPVADEVDVAELAITGAIPSGLNGVLIRNGPNPLSGRFDGHGVLDWWPESAMFHAITIRDGAAVGYRNRWARTRQWAAANTEAEPAPGAAPEVGTGSDERLDTNPNVNLVHHAGELLALAEGGLPLRIDRELRSLGPTVAHPALAAGSTAHPKVDPVTGELVSFVSGWAPPFLRYLVTGPDGATTLDTTIDLPHSPMIHDLAITETRSVLFDGNVGYDLSMLAAGHRIPIRWHDDRPARIGVIPRHGGEPVWVEIEPCFVQHVVNAFDDGPTRIVVDAVRYPWYFRVEEGSTDFVPDPLGVLWRWTIDLERGSVIEGPFGADAPFDEIELPRIDESRTGRANRHLWAVEQPSTVEMRGLRHHDLATGTAQRWVPSPGDQNSEPVFAPRPGATAEGDGWILACVHRGASDTTDVVILDAIDIAAGPVATVHLPRRIPAGFHGIWLADRAAPTVEAWQSG